MKPSRSLVPFLVGVVAATGAWGMLAAGCGNNSSNPVSDAGLEADVQQDVVVADTTSGPEAAADSGIVDSGIADSPVIPSEGGAEVFPVQVATALCNNIAACCGTSPDASTFNWQLCYTNELSAGFHGSSNGANLLDGGHIVFNQAQAQACLSALAAADCVTNQVSAAEQTQLYQTCFAAYTGTLATGSACVATTECAPGNYCFPVDGGVGDAGAIGLCTALAGLGGGCGVFGANQTVAQTVCSYRGAASNGLFCQNIDADADLVQLDAATWTCQQQWAVGSGCYANQDCSSFICHEVQTNVYQCASSGDWYNAGTCATYVTDGG